MGRSPICLIKVCRAQAGFSVLTTGSLSQSLSALNVGYVSNEAEVVSQGFNC